MKPESNGHKGPALIYCRVSTKTQEQEGTSLESQAEACARHAQDLGYSVGRITKEVFSGAELWDRPLLARDRSDLGAGQFQALIAYSTDRLSRNPTHLAIIAEECERAGVELHFVTEPLDTSPEGALIRYVKGYAAAIEREKIRERSIRGKHARALAGKLHNHGYDLYGYRRDKEAGVRLIFEPEASVVRQIYRWYAEEGAGIHRIMLRLNEQGVPAPSTSKKAAPSDQPPMWGHRTIHNILRNPAYKGETIVWVRKQIRVGKKLLEVPRSPDEHVRLPEGTTPPLVSAELWDTVQARLDSNRGATTRNQSRPALLPGLITCAVCGATMIPADMRGFRIYRCSSFARASGACGSRQVPAADKKATGTCRTTEGKFAPMDEAARETVPRKPGIETWVWQQVARILEDPSVIAAELDRRRREGPDLALQGDLDMARRSLAKIERQQQRLVSLYAAAGEDFPEELVRQQLAATEREKDQWRATVADLEGRIAVEQHAIEQLDALTSYCQRVADNLHTFGFEEKRLALEALGIRIVANGWDWHLHGAIPLGTGAAVLSTSWSGTT